MGTHVVSGEVMDIRLRKHGIVFKLAFPKRRSVARDDDEFGFTRSKGFEGGLVAESD